MAGAGARHADIPPSFDPLWEHAASSVSAGSTEMLCQDLVQIVLRGLFLFVLFIDSSNTCPSF